MNLLRTKPLALGPIPTQLGGYKRTHHPRNLACAVNDLCLRAREFTDIEANRITCRLIHFCRRDPTCAENHFGVVGLSLRSSILLRAMGMVSSRELSNAVTPAPPLGKSRVRCPQNVIHKRNVSFCWFPYKRQWLLRLHADLSPSSRKLHVC